jgi:hypothetical protein
MGEQYLVLVTTPSKEIIDLPTYHFDDLKEAVSVSVTRCIEYIYGNDKQVDNEEDLER